MSPPREPLSRERILQAALEILDQQGLEAVSMRAVAGRLGVEAMSLYHHLPGKGSLLDGLYEQVLAQMPPARRRRTWRGALRDRARALRSALAAHPAALPLFTRRPAVTPGALRHVEQALGALRQAGFSPAQALGVFQIVAAFVVGHAALTLGVGGPGADYEALDEAAFPGVREAARALGARDAQAEFEQGLRALLRGLRGP